MGIKEDLRTYLLTLSDVTDVTGQRIAEASMDADDALPYIVYGRTGLSEDICIDGSGIVKETRFDLEVRAASLSAAETISDAVRAGLHGYMGTMGSTRVQLSLVQDVSDDYLPFPPGSDEREEIVALNIEVHHG